MSSTFYLQLPSNSGRLNSADPTSAWLSETFTSINVLVKVPDRLHFIVHANRNVTKF